MIQLGFSWPLLNEDEQIAFPKNTVPGISGKPKRPDREGESWYRPHIVERDCSAESKVEKHEDHEGLWSFAIRRQGKPTVQHLSYWAYDMYHKRLHSN